MTEDTDYGWVETWAQHEELRQEHYRHALEITRLDADGMSYFCQDDGVKWKMRPSDAPPAPAEAGNSRVLVGSDLPPKLVEIEVAPGLKVYVTEYVRDLWEAGRVTVTTRPDPALLDDFYKKPTWLPVAPLPDWLKEQMERAESAGDRVDEWLMQVPPEQPPTQEPLTLEQLIKAETRKRAGMQKKLDVLSASVNKLWMTVVGDAAGLEDLRARVRALEEQTKVEITPMPVPPFPGWLEDLFKREREAASRPSILDIADETETGLADMLCPEPQIGKPPHCGNPNCPYKHLENDKDVAAYFEKLDEAEDVGAGLPNPGIIDEIGGLNPPDPDLVGDRFFALKRGESWFVYDHELRNGEECIAAFWNNLPVDRERWAQDLVNALNRQAES